MTTPYAPLLLSDRGSERYSGRLAILYCEIAVTYILRAVGSIIGYNLNLTLGRWGTGYGPGKDAVIGLSLAYGNPV